MKQTFTLVAFLLLASISFACDQQQLTSAQSLLEQIHRIAGADRSIPVAEKNVLDIQQCLAVIDLKTYCSKAQKLQALIESARQSGAYSGFGEIEGYITALNESARLRKLCAQK
jgi:hypothetical protein